MSDTEPIVGQRETTINPPKPLIRRSNFRLFALAVFYLLFLVIGAAVFAAIEGPNESDLVTHIKSVRIKFYDKHKHCISAMKGMQNTGEDLEKMARDRKTWYKFAEDLFSLGS